MLRYYWMYFTLVLVHFLCSLGAAVPQRVIPHVIPYVSSLAAPAQLLLITCVLSSLLFLITFILFGREI
jgi:hypothetical protein